MPAEIKARVLELYHVTAARPTKKESNARSPASIQWHPKHDAIDASGGHRFVGGSRPAFRRWTAGPVPAALNASIAHRGKEPGPLLQPVSKVGDMNVPYTPSAQQL